MVKFEVVRGRKGPKDKLVKIWAYGEVLSFRDLLFLLKHYFDSEDSYYPISKGFKGRAMLLMAIIEVYTGIPLSGVLKNYKLERKTKKTIIIDKFESVVELPLDSEKSPKKLHEVLQGLQ